LAELARVTQRLSAQMLGQHASLQVHHIFPKALLCRAGYKRADVNAVANFCFLTQDTNLVIGADDPAEYFANVENSQPGALSSQWIPMDRSLWHVDRYLEFLEARRGLLAQAANAFLAGLLAGSAGQAQLAGTAARPGIVLGPQQDDGDDRGARGRRSSPVAGE